MREALRFPVWKDGKKKKANLSGGERKLSPVEDIGGDVAYLMGGVGV